MWSSLSALFTASSLLGLVTASYFPPEPVGIKVLKSKFHRGVTVSYKETFICETTKGVKGYSGYVHLPSNASVGQDYNINLFFWFFESRRDPENAPLAMYFNGGPGSSSVMSATSENGPCYINPDSNSTRLNPWSWNNEVNMLYIDNPNQVGYSYDVLKNGTLDLSTQTITIKDFAKTGVPQVNTTFLVGTFPSQDIQATANTTTHAAIAIWDFLQAWYGVFPKYKPNNDKVSIFGVSFGGHWTIGFSEYISTQNDKIKAGRLPGARNIHLDTVGMINGVVDFNIQGSSYPEYAYNNTYGVQVITKKQYEDSLQLIPTCQQLLAKCKALALAGDPDNLGSNATVNSGCMYAGFICNSIYQPYIDTGRSPFDISAIGVDGIAQYGMGFFNQRWVQAHMGAAVNFTVVSSLPSNAIYSTSDVYRGTFLAGLNDLLDRGVKVALMWGDRDYCVDWFGGEAVSLAIDSNYTKGFQKAGYENLRTNCSYNGGLVRQYGSLSFSRIFQAGHQGLLYQPETFYRIFSRAIYNRDIATGENHAAAKSTYATNGPSSTRQVRNVLPPRLGHICYTWSATFTCDADQIARLQNGSALLKDWVMVGYQEGGRTVLYPKGGPFY